MLPKAKKSAQLTAQPRQNILQKTSMISQPWHLMLPAHFTPGFEPGTEKSGRCNGQDMAANGKVVATLGSVI
ncbi:MAG: hypothetical protein ACI81P_001759, partial [Neolewinella sp.]